jgi:hypothetical protein
MGGPFFFSSPTKVHMTETLLYNDYEVTLLIIKECFVYTLPPRTSSVRGYRAADWNVNQWLWKGRLRITAFKQDYIIRLEDVNSGK